MLSQIPGIVTALKRLAHTANQLLGTDSAGIPTLVTLPASGLSLSGGALTLDPDLATIAAAATADRLWGTTTAGATTLVTLPAALSLSGGALAIDPDLATIAGLTATTDNFMQAKSSAWASRTPAQVLADLGALGKFPFPATQIASAGANDLDDYEEGTFTPTLAFATVGSSSWAYANLTATYTKVGRLVTATAVFDATPTIGTGSGNVQLGGLPFTPASSNVPAATFIGRSAWAWPAGSTQMVFMFGSTTLLMAAGTALGLTNVTAANMTNAAQHRVAFTASYEV